MLQTLNARLALLIAPVCLLAIGQAQQPGFAVAGFGYRMPSSTITAAPGQVLTISVFGVSARLSEPAFPTPGANTTTLPTEVAGLAIDYAQGNVPIDLQLRAVQQTPCPSIGGCAPATTLTFQMPYDLNPLSTAPAVLRVREGGRNIAQINVNPVTDSIHIINSCDQTGIFLSAAKDLPAGVCAPMVMHTNGTVVTPSSPAARGETLVVWAFGLGAVEGSPSDTPLAAQPLTVGLSYSEFGRALLRRLATVTPTYAGMPGGGLYQLHFVVPPPPTNLAPCLSTSGNLRLLLSGPNSADSATICLQ